jgi:hypothetical protein
MPINFELVLLSGGVYSCYLLYGFLQERIFNTDYTG